MSDDLILRLRHPAMTLGVQTSDQWSPNDVGITVAVIHEALAFAVMNEAADEIERLRALLGAQAVPGPSFADIRKTIKPEKGGQADG